MTHRGTESFSRACTLCAALGLVAAAAAQAPQPTFRSRVELKTLFVTVLDRDGAPIEGLGPADFRVTVDGQPRSVVGVDPIRRPAPPAPEAPTLHTSPVSTNASVPAGQLVMIVIDETSLRSGSRSAIQASRGLLDALPDTDLVGLAVLPAGPNVPFTRDRAAVRDALTRVRSRWQPQEIGRASVADNEAIAIARGDNITRSAVIERECQPPSTRLSPEDRQRQIDSCIGDIENVARGLLLSMESEARQSLAYLSGVLDQVYVSEYEGPTAVVFISGGLAVVSPPGEVPAVAATAARANAVVHTVLPDPSMADAERRGLRSMPSLVSREVAASGLQTLAGLSGGRFLPVTGEASGVFSSLARELAAGYRVSIELQPGDMDGSTHRVRVETAAAHASVRSHQHFLGPAPGYRPSAERLTSVLRNQRVLSGLPLKVSTYARQGENAGRVEIVIAGDIGPDEPGEAQLVYRLTDEQGREVLGAESEVSIEAGPPGQPAMGRFLARGEVPPGTYALKIAVAGSRGVVGSVEHPVDASIKWFDLVGSGDLFLAPGTGQDGGRVLPVAECEIRGQPLVALLELYAKRGSPSPGWRPTFEIAGTDLGSPLVDLPMTAALSEDRSRLIAQATAATSLLPPGDYVGRVLVSAGRERVEVARRPFRVLAVDPAATALDPSAAGSSEAGFAVLDALRSLVPRFEVKDVLRPEAAERDLRRAVARSGATSAAVTAIPDEARQGTLTFSRLDEVVEKEAPLVAAMGRGISLLETERFDVAAPQFNRATTLASDYLTALVYLGACYAGQGRDSDAANAWQTALVAEDDSPRVYRLAADALLRRGQADEAIDLLREASTSWPDAADIGYRLALALALADRRDEAYRTLDSALSSDQAPPDAVFLALLLLQQARLAGQPFVSAEADRERSLRLAAAYEAGPGTRKALVRAWAEALQGRPH